MNGFSLSEIALWIARSVHGECSLPSLMHHTSGLARV